jgi:hypothetical protein
VANAVAAFNEALQSWQVAEKLAHEAVVRARIRQVPFQINALGPNRLRAVKTGF